ncbi:MAG TPA: vWA domain-containing protein [Polyangiaceae bacterium]|nr:vWA domain-containing protein [Polyangiaceae bacterium]
MQRYGYLLLKHAALAAVLSLAAGSCSSEEDDDGGSGAASSGNKPGIPTGGSTSANGGNSSGGGGAGNTSGGKGGSVSTSGGGKTSTGGSGSGNATNGGAVAACEGLPFDPDNDPSVEACEGYAFEAEVVPVDMFIMMDRSVSMNELVPGTQTRRWDALHDAVEAFVNSDSIGSIGAGIGFFGISGAKDDTLDCSVERYAEPTVEIGPLSETGPDLVQAMADTVPGGLTPTTPALQGAIQYAKGWAKGHPGRATVVVLVTDGYPTQCPDQPSISAIADAAREGYQGTPSIRSFVIGLAAGFNLNNIAQAGGTKSAYLVDEGDVTNTFTNALLNITNSKIACEYEMPTSSDVDMEVDPSKVQIIYKPASGGQEEVPRLDSVTQCAINPNGGWYYDNPSDPRSIKVCPCTCSRFQAGEVNVRVGCEPKIGIR